MTESEFRRDSKLVIYDWYGIYFFNLTEGLITIEEAEEYLEYYEESEHYLACAGIFKAINNYKAYLNDEINLIIMDELDMLYDERNEEDYDDTARMW